MSDVMQGKVQIGAIILFVLLLKWCVTYHSHSGQGIPPMFGDYEAQRHWQEITLHLPIEEWYRNSTNNDLQYWGLDYPPLTAYHSYIVGKIAHMVDPSYVKLHESRGISSSSHKYFMRLSVLCTDILIYIPALVYFVYNLSIHKRGEHKYYNIFGFCKHDVILLTALVYPGLILIDYGHFQYNCVSLGLFIGAVAAIYKDAFLVASFLFVSAISYKQMELYHSLPFFCYILGMHIPGRNRSWFACLFRLICISATVILTFFIIWAPFLLNGTLFNVIVRLVPLSRGIFEDKVSNIWCAINVFYKLRTVFTNIQLAQICLVTTALAILPACANLLLKPTKEAFAKSLINVALGFFLLSFQVHEKSILLVAAPVILHFHDDPFPCFWFLITSHFSMLPLFIKDGLSLAYVTTILFYIIIVLWIWPDMLIHSGILRKKNIIINKANLVNYYKCTFDNKRASQENLAQPTKNILKMHQTSWILVLFSLSMLGMIVLSIASLCLQAPKKYPDLFSLLVSVYSCGHFLLFYVYYNYQQHCVSKKDTVTKLKTC